MTLLWGHTMGTPGLSVVEALELFARAGLDGAEIVWQDDYLSGLPEEDLDAANEARVRAEFLDLTIGCLTPYVTGINSLDRDERERDVRRLIRCIRTAHMLGCGLIRVYSGRYLAGDANQRHELWSRLTESLHRLAETAAEAGVVLAVENHFNTMTVTAADTVKLVNEIESPAVGILYDQANLAFTYCEGFEEAIALQRGLIHHVHVKDLVFVEGAQGFSGGGDVRRQDQNDRNVASRMVGEGILDWPAIVGRLTKSGYRGPYSLEYEYRWHPHDLPIPGEGFAASSRRMREIFKSVDEAREQPVADADQ